MPCSCMNLGKLCCEVSSETFFNFLNIHTLSALNFHHLLLINLIKSIRQDHPNKEIRIFWTNYYICLLPFNVWKIILVSSSSWLHSKAFLTLLEILSISFLLLTRIGNGLDGRKSLGQRYVTTKLRRCCLFLVLWKNASHSLLDSIFCSKLCKCIHVSDSPFSLLEHS